MCSGRPGVSASETCKTCYHLERASPARHPWPNAAELERLSGLAPASMHTGLAPVGMHKETEQRAPSKQKTTTPTGELWCGGGTHAHTRKQRESAREREREKDRERQRETERERQTEREIHKHTHLMSAEESLS